MAYKSPFNQDPTLKKTISNVFGKTNLPNFSDKKYGGERLYEQPVKGSDYSVPVSDFSDQIGGALAGSTTSTPKGRIDRLKARKDATSNEAKKARIQGKIERTKIRQSSRAERIKDKNIEKLQKTKQRQKIKNIRQDLDPNAGMTDYKSEFKKMEENFIASSGGDSSITPAKMIGAIAGRLQAALGIDAGGNPTRQRSGNILKDAGGLIGAGTRAAGAAPVDPVAPMAPTSGDMQDPFAGKTFSIVESPTNMKGDAKPVFNESTSDAAAMMYGSPAERQMSMPKAGTSAMSMEGPLESNAFIGAKIAAEKAGESTFEVDGKTFNVK